ncbi:ABC transporter permease [Candidatus Bipolaricaulota bacterium]|nr:ABC transporter permease [Candidatus Bipolaricaulota bacterium]
MLGYIFRRILMVIPIMLGVTLIVSSILYLSPGDPARIMLGPNARPSVVKQLREDLGLDKPFHIRYFTWLGDILQGDFGVSLQRNVPVTEMIMSRLPASLELAFFAAMVAWVIALPTGIISAVKPYTIFDNISMFFALFWVSMPSFWLSIVAIIVFALWLGVFPISGYGGPFWTLSGIMHLALPAFCTGARLVAMLTRLIRSKMMDELGKDYVRTARSKGLKEYLVVMKHALRNSLIPTITVFGLQVPALFSLSIIIETVYAWPGMGRLLVDGVFKRDYPLVQGIVLMYTFIVVITNLAVDLIYGYIDPRIKYD